MRARLSAFEYESKESGESNNDTKRLNWLFFKMAPYRSPDMSQKNVSVLIRNKFTSLLKNPNSTYWCKNWSLEANLYILVTCIYFMK